MSAQIVSHPYWSQFDPAPTEQERAVLDRFIDEYMKDYNPVEACMRVGFQLAFAVEYAKIFMTKAYVQRRIAERKSEPISDAEPDKQVVKARIVSTLMECLQNGHPQTRVAASKVLCSIYGYDQAPDQSGEVLNKLVDTFREMAKVLPE